MEKYRAVMIFFLLFSAGLGLYIASQGFSIFRASKGRTAEIGQSPLSCVDYFYSINQVSYDGYTLEFEITNNALTGSELTNLIVEGVDKKRVDFTNFLPGLKRHVGISNIKIDYNFSVYPEGCEVYAKKCTVEECQS